MRLRNIMLPPVQLLLAMTLLLLAGCGGSSSGGRTQIKLDQRALSFTSELDDNPAASQDVHVNYTGDGVAVLAADGELPSWVKVETIGYTAVSADFRITVKPPASTPGEFQTTLRFMTGLIDPDIGGGFDPLDAVEVETVDLKLGYTLKPSSFSAQADVATLHFDAYSKAAPPPAQPFTLTLSDGEAIVNTHPVWLSVTPVPGAPANQPAFSAAIIDTNFEPREQSGLIFLDIYRANGTIRTISLPVSYTVRLGVQLAPTTLAFSGVQGAPASITPATRSFSIGGDIDAWTASSNQPWLQLAQASGSGPQELAFNLDAAGLAAGNHTAEITVSNTATSQQSKLGVQLQLRPPQLTLSASELALSVDAATTPETIPVATVQIGDELGGARADLALQWHVESVSAPWLSASPGEASTAPAAALKLAVVPEQLAALGSGVHQAAVVLAYTDSSGAAQTRTIMATLNLALPRIEHIAPYLGVQGQPGSLVIVGSGLLGLNASQVHLGDATASAIQVLSDTQARISYPALGTGLHTLKIDHLVDAPTSTAQLRVIAPKARAYAAFPVSGAATRMVFDDERETLYVANVVDGVIDRYRYSGSAWEKLSGLSLARLRDIALSRDGRTLYAIADYDLWQIDLTRLPLLPAVLATYPGSGSPRPNRLTLSNDDQLWMTIATNFNGIVALSSYSLRDASFTERERPSAPGTSAAAYAEAAGDGSAVYLTHASTSRYRAPLGAYDSIGSTVSVDAVNHDGSRLGNRGLVYDDGLKLLGRLSLSPVHAVFGQRPDRAFMFRSSDDDGSLGRNVIVVDPTGPLQAGNVYPEIARVPLADDPGTGLSTLLDAAVSPATLSADDRTLFFHGTQKLVIVPLPP